MAEGKVRRNAPQNSSGRNDIDMHSHSGLVTTRPRFLKTNGASCSGHAVDHCVFVLEEEGSMFTADNVLG